MAAIRSFGRYVPARILTNAELAHRLGVEPDWIRSATGIVERRIADESETTASMGALAAEDCLKRTDVDRASLGLVLMSSGSSERRFPGPAAVLAQTLGLGMIPAIDLPLASAGSLFGMALASELTARFGNILVVASEKMSAPGLAEPLTREIAPLFGDGAGACLITADDAGLMIQAHKLHSDGAQAGALRLEFTGPVVMDGLKVILQATRRIPSAIVELLSQYSIPADSVTAFLMHQANRNLIDRVARAVGVSADRFPSNIAKYGNTSSASMLIAAAEYFESGMPGGGETFCFAAFGAGFHWGALLAVAI
jgi:3-oxoacyl-[acyl-carrier-protein] synthase-3